ncbi:tryptophan--tRNA ligase [Candidatus Wolfebacteria bacterium]|nr:tryptophan--tRNA ligase [Candidatus Wolfebacteria bacterium]
MPKPILISGIQPTGKLHIGNYLGALKNFVDLQNTGRYQCYFFIADLHALTENPKAKDLSVNIANLAADFLAAGIDPEKSTVFIQSKISAHSELMWVLNTITPMGELKRMTQFKDKAKTLSKIKTSCGEMYADKKSLIFDEDSTVIANIGLFDYPVLQAADILLYKAEIVPVGEDQLQHLELARALARKFNNKFGKIFLEPKSILTKAPRLMSLDDPSKKMSKSRPAGCLFLDDSPEVIRGKIKKATTDSGREIKYDFRNKPAISNLMTIYSAFSGQPLESIEKRFKNKSYGDFKKELAEVVIADLKPFQERKKQWEKQSSKIKIILKNGAQKANRVSQATMAEVKKKIGLIY